LPWAESFYPLARARHRYSGSSRAKDSCADSIVGCAKLSSHAARSPETACDVPDAAAADLYKQRRIPPRRLGSASSILDDAATRFLQIVDCGAAPPVRSTPHPRRQALPLAREGGQPRPRRQPDAHAVPVEPPLAQGVTSYPMYHSPPLLSTQKSPSINLENLQIFPGPSEIESFTANPIDAPDGLTKQFRIHAQFGSMPPRTMEAINLHFLLKEPKDKSEHRLRFHTATRYLDFSFTFDLTQIAEKSA